MIFLIRQVVAFVGVGAVAAVAHYGCLIGLVEGGGVDPVPATLVGYVAGGLVSYHLNRRHTFLSQRAHREAAWRFALIAGIGFCLTYGCMRFFVDSLRGPYLPAQVATTCIVMVWSFAANRLWTFRATR